jgi:hypothetical protein
MSVSTILKNGKINDNFIPENKTEIDTFLISNNTQPVLCNVYSTSGGLYPYTEFTRAIDASYSINTAINADGFQSYNNYELSIADKNLMLKNTKLKLNFSGSLHIGAFFLAGTATTLSFPLKISVRITPTVVFLDENGANIGNEMFMNSTTAMVSLYTRKLHDYVSYFTDGEIDLNNGPVSNSNFNIPDNFLNGTVTLAVKLYVGFYDSISTDFNIASQDLLTNNGSAATLPTYQYNYATLLVSGNPLGYINTTPSSTNPPTIEKKNTAANWTGTNLYPQLVPDIRKNFIHVNIKLS